MSLNIIFFIGRRLLGYTDDTFPEEDLDEVLAIECLAVDAAGLDVYQAAVQTEICYHAGLGVQFEESQTWHTSLLGY